jgi:hypothetical protein
MDILKGMMIAVDLVFAVALLCGVRRNMKESKFRGVSQITASVIFVLNIAMILIA